MSDEIKRFFCNKNSHREIGKFELNQNWKIKNRHIPEDHFIVEPQNNKLDKVSLDTKNFSNFTFLFINEKKKILDKNCVNYQKKKFEMDKKYTKGFSLDKFLFDLENENNLSDNIKNRFEIFEDSYKAIKDNSRKLMNLQNVNKIYSQKMSMEKNYEIKKKCENKIEKEISHKKRNYNNENNFEDKLEKNQNDNQSQINYENKKRYENNVTSKNVKNYQTKINYENSLTSKNNFNNKLNFQNTNNFQKKNYLPRKITSLETIENQVNLDLIKDLKKKNNELFQEIQKTKKELNMIILGQSTLISQYEKYIQSLQIKNDDLLKSQKIISEKQFVFLETNKKLDKELQKKNFNSSVIEKNYKSKIIELSFEKKNFLEKIIKLQGQLENLKNEKNDINELTMKLDKLEEERENFISESKNIQSTIASLNSKFESTKEELMIYKIKEKKEKSENEKLEQKILDLKKYFLEEKKQYIKENLDLKKKLDILQKEKLLNNENLLLSKISVKNSEKNYFNMAKKISTTPKKSKSYKDKLKNSMKLKNFDILSFNKEPLTQSIETSIIKGGLNDYLNKNNEFSIKKTSSAKNLGDLNQSFCLKNKEKPLKKIAIVEKVNICNENKDKKIKKVNNLNLEYYNGLKIELKKNLNEKKSFSQPQKKYIESKSNFTFINKNSKIENFEKQNLQKPPYYLIEENKQKYLQQENFEKPNLKISPYYLNQEKTQNYLHQENIEKSKKRISNHLKESKKYTNNTNLTFDSNNKENYRLNLQNRKILNKNYFENNRKIINQNHFSTNKKIEMTKIHPKTESKNIKNNFLQNYIQKKISSNKKNLRPLKKEERNNFLENSKKKIYSHKIQRYSESYKNNFNSNKKEIFQNQINEKTRVYNNITYRRVINNNNDERSVSEPRYYYTNRINQNNFNGFKQF